MRIKTENMNIKIFNRKAKPETTVLASLNAFFDMATVLNQRSRPDRLMQFEAEARKHEIQYEIFHAVPDSRAFTSFNKSVLAILKHFTERPGADRLLFMEDDAVFLPNVQFEFALAAAELPEGWDLVYLGCNPIGDGNAHPYSYRLSRITGAWTTHAVGISRATALEILAANLDPTQEGLMLDDWMAKNIHPRGGTFCCKPMLALQRPGYSDLWKGPTDYTKLFQDANKKLK